MRELKTTVVENISIAKGIYMMTLALPCHVDGISSGKFLNVTIPNRKDLILKRPFGICKYMGNTLCFCYQVVGSGTQALSELKIDAEVQITVPLGNGFALDETQKKVALIGGGVGVFPLLSVMQQYGERNFVSYLGFRNADAVCLESEFASNGKTYISTDDGSYGEKGNAVQTFLAHYKEDLPDVILSCGPTVMLKALKSALEDNGINIKTYISAEERMGCGIGACLVCTCKKSGGGRVRVCRDGPVFDITEVEL